MSEQFSSSDMILSNLIHDVDYCSRIFPYLEESYLITPHHKYIFNLIKDYINKHDVSPSIHALEVVFSKDTSNALNDENHVINISKTLNKMKTWICEEDHIDFRIKQTEEQCKLIASENAIEKCADILSNDEILDKTSILSIMEEALAIEFDEHLGVDFEEDVGELYDEMHEKRVVTPLGIDNVDKSMGGGLEAGGVYVWIGNSGTGKSSMLVDNTVKILKQSKNVLFVTLEMVERKIGERTAANLLDMSTTDLKTDKLSREEFINKLTNKIKNKGKLHTIYDSSNQCTALKIKKWVKELQMKKNFNPDVIIIDHLSNMQSYMLPRKGNVRGDEVLEAITNELDSMSKQLGVPVLTAEQTIRHAKKKIYPEPEDVAGGYGIYRKASWMGTIGEDDQMIKEGKWAIGIIKTRFSNMVNFRFTIGVDKDKQKTRSLEEQKKYNASLKIDGKPTDIQDIDFGGEDSLDILTQRNKHRQRLMDI